MTKEQAMEAARSASPQGFEWIMTFLEDGKAKVCSTPSEAAARAFLTQHPEATLYYGNSILFPVELEADLLPGVE